MNNEKIKQLQDYVFEISSLINITCDSCELNMYTNQTESLKIAQYYFSKLFELLSEFET